MTCTSLLHTQGYDKSTAKKHLLVFALAAPVAAFFSYFGLTRVREMQRLWTIIYMYLIIKSLLFIIHMYTCIMFFIPTFQIMYTVQFPITGFSMLLSAGTFLYVATVHVLSEITRSGSHSAPSSSPDSAPGSHANSKLSRAELFLVVFGALLPLLFNAIHSHSH